VGPVGAAGVELRRVAQVNLASTLPRRTRVFAGHLQKQRRGRSQEQSRALRDRLRQSGVSAGAGIAARLPSSGESKPSSRKSLPGVTQPPLCTDADEDRVL